MKIATHSISRNKIIVASVAIVLLISGVVAALEKTGVIDIIKSNPTATGPTPEQQQVQKKTEQEAKQDFIESPDPASTPENKPASTIELSAQQEPNNSVTVLTKLYDVASGSCTLSIKNAGQTHTETAQVIYQPSFSSCAGFSIPKSKLGPGNWSITVLVQSDASLEKTITLGVN